MPDQISLSDDERGKIINKDRANQHNDYSNLKFGKCTPTDIDGLLELGDELYIFIEAKMEGMKMGRGQQMAFERVTQRIQAGGADCYLFVAHHNVGDPENDVDVGNLPLTLYYHKGAWRRPDKQITVCDAATQLIEKKPKLKKKFAL